MSLLIIGLANSLAALILAVCVRVLARFQLPPAVTHALWVLVLLKLVSPPLFLLMLNITPHGVSTSLNLTTDSVLPMGGAIWLPQIVLGIGIVWAVGAAVQLIRQTLVFLKFIQRVNRHSHPATADVQALVREVAEELGVRRPPRILLCDVCSPMLCGIPGWMRIMLPRWSWEQYTPAIQRSIVAHELVHFQRRDHWVRFLEVVTQILYWWLPAVWWAADRIEEVQEECCDAQVLRRLKTSPRSYAEALLETLEQAPMSSAQITYSTNPLSWLSLFQWFGSRTKDVAVILEQRFRHIMKRDVHSRMSSQARGLYLLGALGCLLICPLMWSQEQQTPVAVSPVTLQAPPAIVLETDFPLPRSPSTGMSCLMQRWCRFPPGRWAMRTWPIHLP